MAMRFQDSLTEELEETTRTEIYEDYRFVTREELEQLGLTGLVRCHFSLARSRSLDLFVFLCVSTCFVSSRRCLSVRRSVCTARC